MSIQNFLKALASNSRRRRPIRVGRSLRDRQRVSEKPAYTSRPAGRRPPASRLRIEPLEDRRLLSFTPGVDYAVGTSPQAVVTADFNNDGRLDVATANSSSNSVSVLLGNADGTFQPAQHSAIGATPLSMAVGEFNADGKLDLATANTGDVSLLLGNGNGTFQLTANLDIGSRPSSVVTGDFNGDSLAERWEYFSVDLSSPSANASIGDDHALGTVADDEPRITVNSAQVVEGNSGTSNALITLSMEAASDGPVTVNWSTADSGAVAGSEYQASSGTATFAFGGPLTQTIAVPIMGDRLFEYPAEFYVNLDNGYWGTVMILDDEPRLSISSYVGVDEGDTGTTPAVFIVSLAYAYDQPVSVNFATSEGGNDFQTQSGSLTFAAGQTSANITVAVYGDTLIEETEYFSVYLSGASPNAVHSNGHGLGIIGDDDEPMTKFYVVDASSDKTFEYAAGGQSVENYGLRSGNSNPRGAASDASGERVWVIDNNDNVYVYDDAGNSLGSWKAKGLNTPEGIASDGTDIWIVDRGNDRVYRYAGAANRTSGNANPTSSFALNSGNKDAKGIETDGTHLWVVNDNKTDKVFKYTLSGTLVGSWTISGANTTPTGITLDPSNPSDVWIVDSGHDQVFQYTAAADRTSGSQSASAVFNLAAGNTNPQGIADPPPAGQASRLTTLASKADLRAATAGPARSVEVVTSFALAAEPRGRGVWSRPSDETPLIPPQRPYASAALSIRTFALGATTSQADRNRRTNESDEYFHVNAYNAVFADIARLGDILNDDRH